METAGPILSISVQVKGEKELEEVLEVLRAAGAGGLWIQLCMDSEALQQVSLWDLLDPVHDAGVRISSIRVVDIRPESELIEKLAVVASETAGRTAIISSPNPQDLGVLEEWLQVFAAYQARLLLEPRSARETHQLYKSLRELIGGVLGFSQVQENFPSTEHFLRVLTPYLQMTHNVQVSNYGEGRVARILTLGVYNNPLLLRMLVSHGYSGQLTIGYEKAPASLSFLLEEHRAVDSFLKSLEEKI